MNFSYCIIMKLIIVSNRLPVKVVREDSQYKITKSDGGVATGLESLETDVPKHWIGWPGICLDDDCKKSKLNRELKKDNLHPVYLSEEYIENYYEGYSNSILWPLCHYFHHYIRHEPEYWEAYKEVNEIFCKSALKIIEPGDLLWVQDYQLMLVPGMVRQRMANVCIGYFHHIPFPSYELFRALPERKELLTGLMGADYIGFHTHSYMQHFINSINKVLKLDCEMDEVHLHDRIVYLNARPMGINFKKFYNAILNPLIKQEADLLKETFGNTKIILSVDRLDYSKGILIRLSGFTCFLNHHPEYRKKVTLVMIVSPSRDKVSKYNELKDEIDKMVGAINGQFSTMDWVPVHYFYRSFDFEKLCALYYIADIALVTPLRDGMNLVAKEYLATKRNKPGILILSEMAGASTELSETLIVNPNDIGEIEDALVKALKMPVKKQKRILKSMQKTIATNTVNHWAEHLIEELRQARQSNDNLRSKILRKESFSNIKHAYDQARNRLIILDYDGTLVGFKNDPGQSVPTYPLLDILKKLGHNRFNKVVVSSGRNRALLDKWLGKLPIDLAAEHGAFYKENGIWHENLPEIQWNDYILKTMELMVRKTPGSLLEIKKTSLVFHYRKVDPGLAELRVNQLINALVTPCSKENLQIMKGNKIIEIKSPHYNKGSDAQRLLEKKHYDFILAMGDDTTDDELFMSLPEEAITIKVGKNSKIAKYNLPNQNKTLYFLNRLIK